MKQKSVSGRTIMKNCSELFYKKKKKTATRAVVGANLVVSATGEPGIILQTQTSI